MMRKKKPIQLTTAQYNLLLKSLSMGSGDHHEFRNLIQHDTDKKRTITADGSVSDDTEKLLTLNPLQLTSVSQSHTDIETKDRECADQSYLTTTQHDEAPVDGAISHHGPTTLDGSSSCLDISRRQSFSISGHDKNRDEFDVCMYGAGGHIESYLSMTEAVSSDDVYSQVPDILNAGLKLPAHIQIGAMKTSSDRLILLGEHSK